MANDVYLGFSTTDVWLSKLIRGFTGAKYSHCWVRHGSEIWGGQWVTQADWPVVRTWPWALASKPWSRKVFYRPRFDIHPALAKVRPDFEERYDVLGLFGMFFVLVSFKWFKHRLKNPLASKREMFCSEFVGSILQAAQLPGTADWNTEAITPKEVEAYCAGHPELFDRFEQLPESAPADAIAA